VREAKYAGRRQTRDRTLLVTSADSGDSIDYMDVRIQREVGSISRLTTVLYDKREHLPLSRLFIIKYPHASSNISSAAKYGIITSQYHRLRRIIMDRSDFTFRMAGIIGYMRTKGHDVTHMMSRLHKLCRRFTELYGTHPHDIYQQTANNVTHMVPPPLLLIGLLGFLTLRTFP